MAGHPQHRGRKMRTNVAEPMSNARRRIGGAARGQREPRLPTEPLILGRPDRSSATPIHRKDQHSWAPATPPRGHRDHRVHLPPSHQAHGPTRRAWSRVRPGVTRGQAHLAPRSGTPELAGDRSARKPHGPEGMGTCPRLHRALGADRRGACKSDAHARFATASAWFNEVKALSLSATVPNNPLTNYADELSRGVCGDEWGSQ